MLITLIFYTRVKLKKRENKRNKNIINGVDISMKVCGKRQIIKTIFGYRAKILLSKMNKDEHIITMKS